MDAFLYEDIRYVVPDHVLGGGRPARGRRVEHSTKTQSYLVGCVFFRWRISHRAVERDWRRTRKATIQSMGQPRFSSQVVYNGRNGFHAIGAVQTRRVCRKEYW